MSVGDVWRFSLGEKEWIEVGLHEGNYVVIGKAQFDQIAGPVPPTSITYGAISLSIGHSGLRKVDESIVFLSGNHDPHEGTEGGHGIVQAAISVDGPDEKGMPGRVVFRTLTQDTKVRNGRLLIMQVGRIFERSDVYLKVGADELTGFETVELALEEITDAAIGGRDERVGLT